MPGPWLLWRRSPFMHCLKKEKQVLHFACIHYLWRSPPLKVCVLFALFHDILFIFLGLLWGKPRFNELFMNYPVISILVRLLGREMRTSRSVISSVLQSNLMQVFGHFKHCLDWKFSRWTFCIPDWKISRFILKISNLNDKSPSFVEQWEKCWKLMV